MDNLNYNVDHGIISEPETKDKSVSCQWVYIVYVHCVDCVTNVVI